MKANDISAEIHSFAFGILSPFHYLWYIKEKPHTHTQNSPQFVGSRILFRKDKPGEPFLNLVEHYHFIAIFIFPVYSSSHAFCFLVFFQHFFFNLLQLLWKLLVNKKECQWENTVLKSDCSILFINLSWWWFGGFFLLSFKSVVLLGKSKGSYCPVPSPELLTADNQGKCNTLHQVHGHLEYSSSLQWFES